LEKNILIKSGKYNLAGILTSPGNKGVYSPLVIMCHGFTGSKSESHFLFTKTARFLAKNGISSLRFDFMGSGDSEGSFEKMTLGSEIKDGKNAVAFLKSGNLFDTGKTGVLGFSMGSVTAACIAAQFGMKSLVLWSPVAFLSELSMVKKINRTIKKKLSEEGKAYFPEIGHYIGRKFFDSLKETDPLEYARHYRGNVLIIHAKEENFKVEHPLAYFKAFHKNAVMPQFLMLDEGGHTFKTEFSEKTVIQETASFFAATLG